MPQDPVKQVSGTGPTARTILMSPVMDAATAINRTISDVRELFNLEKVAVIA